MSTEYSNHAPQPTPFDSEEEEDQVDLVEVNGKPCRLYEIVIRGNERTKNDLIERYFEAARNCTTFEELVVALIEGRHELLALGIFESVDIVADEGPPHLPGTATAYVTVQENTGVSGSVGSYIQGHEQMFEAKGELKNKLGYGESVEGQLSLGKETSSALSLGIHVPRRFGHWYQHIHQTWHCWKRFSSHSQILRGLSLRYSQGDHSLSYDIAWRNNKNEDPASASPAIRRMLGHSLLSALTYEWSLNKMDSRSRPRAGYSVTTSTQIAGLGPGNHFTRFFKQDMGVKVAIPLPLPLNPAMTMSVRTGLLLPWSASTTSSLINDRFFVGGPHPLRGFRSQGIGPTDMRPGAKGLDRLGGDILFTATAGLSFDLPNRILKQLGIHGHAFACAGNLLPLSTAMSSLQRPRQLLKDFRDTIRCSIGVGVVLPTKIVGRLELNYCWILRKMEQDRTVRHGVQVCWNSPA